MDDRRIALLVETVISLIERARRLDPSKRVLAGRIWIFIFFSLVIASVAAVLAVERYYNLPRLVDDPYNVVIGAPLLLLGLAVWSSSIYQFKRAMGSPAPLVTTGLYARVRNPIVTGLFLMLTGVGILFNSPLVTLALVPAIIMFMIVELKLIEEPELERRLGAEYAEYRRRTPMFLPEIRRRK